MSYETKAQFQTTKYIAYIQILLNTKWMPVDQVCLLKYISIFILRGLQQFVCIAKNQKEKSNRSDLSSDDSATIAPEPAAFVTIPYEEKKQSMTGNIEYHHTSSFQYTLVFTLCLFLQMVASKTVFVSNITIH